MLGGGAWCWGGVPGAGGCLVLGGAWCWGGVPGLGGGIPACTEARVPTFPD